MACLSYNFFMTSNYAIRAEGVKKNFGKVEALRGVNLKADHGRVTGLLGPNGAGKSTLINIMTTLLEPTEGEVEVNGINVRRQPAEARRHFGLAGQFAAVDEFLTGRETLEMVGKLYHLPGNQAKQRADEILEQLGLTDAGDRQTKTYSGGMRRRLDLGASLVATPKVLFLDEPTTGLDPRTRLQLWGVVRDLASQGVSILLTTQYLEEADALADYMYVIDQGLMVTEGTSAQLKNSLGRDIISIQVDDDAFDKSKTLLSKKYKDDLSVDELTNKLLVQTKKGSDDLLEVAGMLKKDSIKPEELSLHRPSLDEVFLAVTGQKPEDRK